MRHGHQLATKKGYSGILLGELYTEVAERDDCKESIKESSMAQSLDLVGDKVTSALVPLQVLLDLDLQTRVSSSEVEEESL